jgi:predicted phosphoadenosine phosphosulfate sulfurtransferase
VKGEWRKGLGVSVLEAAQARIADVFDSFPRVYLSGPSGKDSGVMMHLACLEARRRGRRIGVLYLDLEAQYALTIANVREMFALYADVIDPYWVALPLHLRNAVSQHDPYWVSWDPRCREAWVREPDPQSITDPAAFPFYRAPDGAGGAMEFEEFIDEFGHWYGAGEATACLVGIRATESLNRWRAVVGDHHRFGERKWTTWKGRALYNAYPIYDWKTQDVWTFYGRTGLPHNRIYDLMHKAGVPLAHQRICQPYGDDQRRGLWLYHILEPVTWSRVVARVSGARSGALYANKSGNVQGNRVVTLPPSHDSWESFARFLLDSMPAPEARHYKDKISVFVRYYETRGYADGIPDEADPHAEAARKAPSWRRIAKVILKNDRLCKGLGFSQTDSGAYEKYRAVMRKREKTWKLFLV